MNSTSPIRALCPGSFDPITNGHIDIIERAADLFGEVIVAVGKNSTKDYMFTLDERVDFVRSSFTSANVSVEVMDGLLVDFAERHKIDVVVKGLRFASDFDYELQMAHMNKAVTGIETVFLPAGSKYGTLSSTMLRQISYGGRDISEFVPAAVAEAMSRRARNKDA